MRRIATLFFCFLLLFLMTYRPKDKLSPVFEELNTESTDQNAYKRILLSCESIPLTTKNFSQYFKEEQFQLLELYPSQLPVYMKRLQMTKYAFTNQSTNQKLKLFTDYYLNKLEKAGFNSEVTKVFLSGIALSKVTLYGKVESFQQLFQKYPNLKKEAQEL